MEEWEAVLSSGVIAALTGEKNYEELERIQWEFLDFVRSHKTEFKNWAEAWAVWERQKSEKTQEPLLFEETASCKPRETLMLSGYETAARKKKPQPDYSQFGLPGFGPKFGEVRKTNGKRKRTPINQLPLGM